MKKSLPEMRLVFTDVTLKQSDIHHCGRVQICCTQKIVASENSDDFFFQLCHCLSVGQVISQVLLSGSFDTYEGYGMK
jgi:hypothetical protein